MKLDLRQLRHVLALDRYRNFARAAEAIGLTQPALSRSIQALEDSVGAKLFDRDRSGVEPTAVGARLVERARPLLTQARDVELDLELMIGVADGSIRIGAGPYPAEISVGQAVGRLVRRHPALALDLSVDDWPELTARVLSGELDVAVAETSLAQDDGRLTVEALPRHAGRFVCRPGHPLTGREGLTLEDVQRYPLVLTSVPPRLRDLLPPPESVRQSDDPDGATATSIHVDSTFLARQIVMGSDAVTMATTGQSAADVALGLLVVLPLEVSALHTGYGIIRLARRTPAPATVEFMAILREVEAAL